MRIWEETWRRWRSRRERSALETLRRSHTGEGARLARTVQVYGWQDVRIGRHSMVCDDSQLNALNTPGAGPRIVIGDYCLLGRRNFLNAGSLLVFGDFCLTGSDCHFLGCDHAHDSPFVPYLAAGNAPGGTILLGANVWLGARVTVLKNVRIGHGSIVGAASVVTKDIPPFAVAAGSPSRVFKRFSTIRNAWVATEEFSAEDEAGIPNEVTYLENLRRLHPRMHMPHRALGRECGDC